MSTEAQRRAWRKHYQKIKDLPETKAAEARRRRQYRDTLLADPVNRERVYAIKDYMDDHGLKAKGLALLIGCEIPRIGRMTTFRARVNPEEFKAIPDLYDTLIAIRAEEEEA